MIVSMKENMNSLVYRPPTGSVSFPFFSEPAMDGETISFGFLLKKLSHVFGNTENATEL